MTCSQCAELVSASFGLAGTIVLYFSSYALQPFQGGVFGSHALNELNDKIRMKNAKRLRFQKIGLILLCLSFATQVVAVLVGM